MQTCDVQPIARLPPWQVHARTELRPAPQLSWILPGMAHAPCAHTQHPHAHTAQTHSRARTYARNFCASMKRNQGVRLPNRRLRIPRTVGYPAAWDTLPRGIPCRSWMPCRVGYQCTAAVQIAKICLIPCTVLLDVVMSSKVGHMRTHALTPVCVHMHVCL